MEKAISVFEAAPSLADEAQALRRVACEVQASAEWLRSPYMEGLLAQAVGEALMRSQSPWADRRAAAAYAHCSPSEIDRAANAGIFKRYLRAGTPMFRKEEMDEAIAKGRWTRRGISQKQTKETK